MKTCNTHTSLILNLVHPVQWVRSFTDTQIWFQSWTYPRQSSWESHGPLSKTDLSKTHFVSI